MKGRQWEKGKWDRHRIKEKTRKETREWYLISSYTLLLRRWKKNENSENETKSGKWRLGHVLKSRRNRVSIIYIYGTSTLKDASSEQKNQQNKMEMYKYKGNGQNKAYTEAELLNTDYIIFPNSFVGDYLASRDRKHPFFLPSRPFDFVRFKPTPPVAGPWDVGYRRGW